MGRILLTLVICVAVCGCAVERKFSPAETNARMEAMDYHMAGAVCMEQNHCMQYIWSNDYGDDITVTIGGVGTMEEYLVGCEVTDHHMFYEVCNRQVPIIFVHGDGYGDAEVSDNNNKVVAGRIVFVSTIIADIALLGLFALSTTANLKG